MRTYIEFCNRPFADVDEMDAALIANWNRKHYGAIHCHGHSHGNYDGEGRIIDVGVDSAPALVGEYRPLNLAEVVEMVR